MSPQSPLLCDTGPVVVLLDDSEAKHALCVSTAKRLPATSLLTTLPWFTEAIYLLGRSGGYRAQDALWQLVNREYLQLHLSTPDEIARMQALMSQYRDIPMDLADASLVAAAEALSGRRIFTLDSHFRAYRIGGRETFDVIP